MTTRNSWLLTLGCQEPAYSMYIHRAGEGRLRLPFEPLAAGRALAALPVVVRLVADHLHHAAVVARGDGGTGPLASPPSPGLGLGWGFRRTQRDPVRTLRLSYAARNSGSALFMSSSSRIVKTRALPFS